MIKDSIINSTDVYFVGLFGVSQRALNSGGWKSKFKISNFADENKFTFKHKYYENWLNSIFIRDEHGGPVRNHFVTRRKNDKVYQLERDTFNAKYTIDSFEVFIFPNDYGIFVIKTKLLDLEWSKIGRYTYYMRRILHVDDMIYPESPLINFTNDLLQNSFIGNSIQWKQMNAHLKCAIYTDINQSLEGNVLHNTLYSLGTLFDPTSTESHVEDSYKNEMLKNNTIQVYKNWRSLILEDTLTRVSINYRNKALEDEYFIIYLYTVYTKYFLQRSNEDSGLSRKSIKNINSIRREYFQIINDYLHSKISYKYLPNLYYSKIKSVFGVNDEIGIIEKKLTRLNELRQEDYENRVNKVLSLLTILTIISVAYDGGQMMACEDSIAFIWSWIILIVTCFIFGGLFLYKILKKSD